MLDRFGARISKWLGLASLIATVTGCGAEGTEPATQDDDLRKSGKIQLRS